MFKQVLITLALSEDEAEVLVLSHSRKTVLHRQPFLPDVDGDEVAVKMAAIEAVREML